MTLFDLTVGDMMNESILGRAQGAGHHSHRGSPDPGLHPQQAEAGGRLSLRRRPRRGHAGRPLYQCWKHIVDTFGPGHTIYMSPAGKTFVEADAAACGTITTT